MNQSNKLKKKRHDVDFDAVRGVIHEWDPYGLLAMGCPLDEFDSEIGAVVGQIARIVSVQDAVHVLSRVFSSSFDTQHFRFEDCQAAGTKLFQTLQERGVLTVSEEKP